jgi:large subunit ribosomal protein L18
VASEPVRKLSRNARRQRIHLRVRMRVLGTAVRPRLCVYRSNGQIYAQVIDDGVGRTIAAASSLDADARKELKSGSSVAAAKVIGKLIAERARAVGVEQVVFDRGGYMYHGRVEALAAAAREAGLKF